jgi:hypothetical protein
MKKNTLIEHKEIVVICEESGPMSLNYNVLLTTLKANIVVKHVVPIVIDKSTLTYTNCGKTCTIIIIIKKVLVIPSTTIMSTKPIAKIKTQLVKLGRIPIHYPCIICSNAEHRF